MAQEEIRRKESVLEFFRGSNGYLYISCCIVCGGKIMTEKDSVAGVICENPGCREELPRKLETTISDLADAKGDLEEMRGRMQKMEEMLRSVREHIRTKEDKKGDLVGTITLSKSMITDIEEALI